jgi:tetratricopeptide (TPR) repeat protein
MQHCLHMSVNPEFIERYQLEYQKNPRSKVFAPLAEAYRKMGLLEEAAKLCSLGTKIHPDFAGGFVAYAKILLDQDHPADAYKNLERATTLSPDNLLAQMLSGETLLKLRKPKDALKAFKMVLFLNPDDTKARAAVKKWEFLTADEYEDDVFEMRPLFEPEDDAENDIKNESDEELESLLKPAVASTALGTREILAERHRRALERAVSLSDAYTVRNDLETARKVLDDAKQALGPAQSIDSRIEMLKKRMSTAEENETGDTPSSSPEVLAMKRATLETLLRRINARRLES